MRLSVTKFLANLISELLLTQFWPNLKGRFMGPSSTDSICHGDICPYQKYISCYWSDVDQTLNVGSWDHRLLIQYLLLTYVDPYILRVIPIHFLIRYLLHLIKPMFENVCLHPLTLGVFCKTRNIASLIPNTI